MPGRRAVPPRTARRGVLPPPEHPAARPVAVPLPDDPAGLERRRRDVLAGGYRLRASASPDVVIAVVGALVPEAPEAADRLTGRGVHADVAAITSADRLWRPRSPPRAAARLGTRHRREHRRPAAARRRAGRVPARRLEGRSPGPRACARPVQSCKGSAGASAPPPGPSGGSSWAPPSSRSAARAAYATWRRGASDPRRAGLHRSRPSIARLVARDPQH